MSLHPSPWPLLAAPADVQKTVALALPPGDRLSLSRAHPSLREAASKQGWFERETVTVEGRPSMEELSALAAWARRNRAQLNVASYGSVPLAALHGTRVASLVLDTSDPLANHALCGFSELSSLILWGTPPTVPPALSSLTALEELDLCGATELGAEGGGLEHLAPLTRLRSLSLRGCGLHTLPPALSGLTGIESLDLLGNKALGAGGRLQPLAALTRLRELGLHGCTLRAVPPALTSLTALEELDLSCNEELGEEGGGLERLAALTRLRKLALYMCGLRALPPALSGLTTLEDLSLYGNEGIGAEDGGLQHLSALRRMRVLNLGGCRLRAVATALSGLAALEDLDLGYSWLVEEGVGLERLAALTHLRVLSLERCRLQALPPALSSLNTLERLNLHGNLGMWQGGGGLEHLRSLAALRQVVLPDHLAALLPGLQALMPSTEFCTDPERFYNPDDM